MKQKLKAGPANQGEGPATPAIVKSPDAFLTESQLQERLPLSRRTLYDLRTSGKLPFVRLPGARRLLFHWPTVEAALLRQQRGMEA